MCRHHVKHPDRYTGNFSAFTGSAKELRRDLAEAWKHYADILCHNCYDAALTAVGHAYKAAFRKHTDARAQTIAATLVDLDLWATGYEGEGSETVGQRALRAANETPVWSHPDPMDTAAHMIASTRQAPFIECGHERYKKSFFSNSGKYIFVSLFTLNGWVVKVPGVYDLYSSTTFLIGGNGAHTKVDKIAPSRTGSDRAIFDSESAASKARTALVATSVPWSSLPQTRQYDPEGAAAKVLARKILRPLTSDA